MSKFILMNILSFLAMYSLSAQISPNMNQLVGRWELHKVEVLEKEGDSIQHKISPSLKSIENIPFRVVECLTDGKTKYQESTFEGLGEEGNIQINEDGTLIFHGKNMGYYFNFKWLKDYFEFTLEYIIYTDQQSEKSEHLMFYYQKIEL